MHRLTRLIVAALACAPLAGGLVACGGDDLGSASAQDVLKQTFGPNKPVKSGKLDLTLAVNAKGAANLSGPLRAELQGPFSSQGSGKIPTFDFDLALNVGGQAVSAGAVSTGTKGYLKFGGQVFDLGDATFSRLKSLYAQDQQRAQKSKSPTFAALGVDPSRWLKDPKKVGDETVGGADTVHVTSAVDVPALLTDLDKLLGRAGSAGVTGTTGAGAAVPKQLTPQQRATIQQSVKSTSLDVFSGKADGILRRLTINVTYDVPANLRKTANGLTTGSVGLDLTIADLNQPQTFKAPTGARPLSDLTQALGAGGTTGTTGAVPQTGTTGDASSPQARYSQCLSDAGADIAKVQACAPLLNGK